MRSFGKSDKFASKSADPKRAARRVKQRSARDRRPTANSIGGRNYGTGKNKPR